jgi:hypothetical protein
LPGQLCQVGVQLFFADGKVFLFRVENLSVVFRAKFISGLQKKLPQDKQFIRELYKTNWVVYAKEPFAGPEQVIEYLGRYTHKVAISNHRLLNVEETGVRFRWRDYRDNKVKEMTMEVADFLCRFCQHLLPADLFEYAIMDCSPQPVGNNFVIYNRLLESISQRLNKRSTGKISAANTLTITLISAVQFGSGFRATRLHVGSHTSTTKPYLLAAVVIDQG